MRRIRKPGDLPDGTLTRRGTEERLLTRMTIGRMKLALRVVDRLEQDELRPEAERGRRHGGRLSTRRRIQLSSNMRMPMRHLPAQHRHQAKATRDGSGNAT